MMRMKFLIAVAAIGSIMLSCSARRSEPVVGPLPLPSPEIAEGRKVFMVHCHQCHPGGEAGLGPAINNKPLPAFAIRMQIRYGFGAMPAFYSDEISETELDTLVTYLKALRRHG
jgi:mono/diheme cytochrome c family protein